MKPTVSPRPTAILAVVSVALLVACSTTAPGSANPATTPSAAATTSSSTVVASSTPPNPISSAPTTRSTATEPTSRTPTGPAVLPTDLSGTVYGFVKGVDVAASQLTLDKIDWFTGAAAAQACDEDAVPQDGRVDEWCSMYYFRNVNPALRVVTVSPDVAVTTLDGNTPVAGDLAALADRITTPTGSSRPYRLQVTDGAVTEITEVYQP